MYHWNKFSHTMLCYLSLHFVFCIKAGLMNKGLNSSAALGVTKFVCIIGTNLVTLFMLLKSALCLLHWGQFDEQGIKLNCNFRCDQICKNHWNKFIHSMLCYLIPTSLFCIQAGLMNKGLNSSASLGVTEFARIIETNLVTLCCPT